MRKFIKFYRKILTSKLFRNKFITSNMIIIYISLAGNKFKFLLELFLPILMV